MGETCDESIKLCIRQLLIEVELSHVDLEDFFSVVSFREVTLDRFVDSTGSEESDIHKIGSRCCSHDEDPITTFNTIKVAKELIDNSIGDCCTI